MHRTAFLATLAATTARVATGQPPVDKYRRFVLDLCDKYSINHHPMETAESPEAAALMLLDIAFGRIWGLELEVRRLKNG